MASDRYVDIETGNAWTRFWFSAAPLTGLRALRVLSGVLFCAWMLSFLGHERAFFGLDGWFDLRALTEAQEKNIPLPPLGWSLLYLGIAPAVVYWGSLVVLALFTLGVATRITSILSWVVVVSFLANPVTTYEGDYLLGILAFYLMLGHVGVGLWNGDLLPWEYVLGSRHDLLVGSTLLGPPARQQTLSYAATWMMRLLQIHFAIIMVTSGLHKLQMGDWWGGVALWYPLHPPFQTTAETLARERPNAMSTIFVLSLVQYVVLAWQIGFPLFAWRTGWWRAVLLGGAAIGWLGVFFIYKLPIFGPFVMLCALSYLTPREWAWVASLGQRIVGTAPATKSVDVKKPMTLAEKEGIKK